MNILADQYLYKIDQLIPDQIDVTFFDPDQGLPEKVTSFDALLVRTVIPFNEETLPEAGNIRFIGTASAGYDHLDTDHLNRLGISYSNSTGCNANAVAEYIVTVLYKWAKVKNLDLNQKEIGVVGCGNTGGALNNLLRKLNLKTVLYDPPKENQHPSFTSASLDELLRCDILSFHTPLTAAGPCPTFHMCNKDWLQSGFDLVINAARGGVVNESDLLSACAKGLVKNYILDVWEGEPLFSDEMARKAFIATPHIAGYSKEAKVRASEMIVEELLKFLRIEPENRAETSAKAMPDPPDSTADFADFLWKLHKVEEYDRELRKLIGRDNPDKGLRFAKLRSETELRIEFRSMAQSMTESSVPDQFRVFQEDSSG